MIGFDHIFYSKYTAFADIYVLPLLIDPVLCLPCAECCGGPGHSEKCVDEPEQPEEELDYIAPDNEAPDAV